MISGQDWIKQAAEGHADHTRETPASVTEKCPHCMREAETSKAAAAMGRAGRGASKRRGDSSHYRKLGERKAMYTRAITSWHKDEVGPLTVWWIDGTEGTGRRICSVLDPTSQEPATRVLRDGTRERLDDEPAGLVIYGTHKWDRPTLDEWPSLVPDLAHLVEAIRAL